MPDAAASVAWGATLSPVHAHRRRIGAVEANPEIEGERRHREYLSHLCRLASDAALRLPKRVVPMRGDPATESGRDPDPQGVKIYDAPDRIGWTPARIAGLLLVLLLIALLIAWVF